MRPIRIAVLLLACTASAGCAQDAAPRPPPRETSASSPPAASPAADTVQVDLGRHFTGMQGTFVLLDAGSGQTRVYNPRRAAERFLPASTFKVPNTLIALETGVATGPDFAMPWDSAAVPPQPGWPETWKRDQTLRTALRNSVYWYYQEIARRIGERRMREHLARFQYGNQDVSGGIDRFWQRGGLRISPNEQVAFLRRLYEGQLGVSDRTLSTVKELLVLEETPEYRLSGKTGTVVLAPGRELGWLVGWVESRGTVHIYALNMEGPRVWTEWPPQKRPELVKAILRDLHVI